MLLADLGADVLKVEEPGKGDYIRWLPPMASNVSAGHVALNRGKRSMTLNLKRPEGVEILKRLVRDADVLVESFRPGVMDRLRAGYDVLAAENPRLVYCAITGYGQDGPYAQRAGHDANYLGYAGVLSIIGDRDGPPVIPGVQIADLGGGGLMATIGILAALAERERTRTGRFVDISMMDGAMSWLSIHAQGSWATGEVPRRGRMGLSGQMACYGVYQAGDGRYVTVGALEPQFWRALCEAVGLPELIERQFAGDDEQDEIRARLQEVLLTKSRDEWCAELEHLDTCFGPVKDFDEAVRDPHVRARGMVTEVPLPGGGTQPALGNPIRLRGDDAGPLNPPPGIGEHTDEALRAAGYSDSQIEDLRSAGVL